MSDRPNFIFIITDNQSDWTLGCYGNNEIQTPNIDRLAADGMRFDNAFCVNPVCSPNRATYLTGLMPSQHGVHSWLGGEVPDSQMGADAYCTIGEFPNLPEMLHENGYRSGMVGKWHLGDSVNPQLGFDYWFAKPKGHTHSFYDSDAIWKGEVYTEPRYFTDVIAEHAVDFLTSCGDHGGHGEDGSDTEGVANAADADHDQPFFLYVGFNGPYGLDNDLRTGHRNRWTEYYADKELSCFPRIPTHPWQRQNLDLIGSETAMRGYAAAISGVDDAVGRILDTLESTGKAKNTCIVYTADHGLCAGHHGFWGMGDHTRPMHMADENLHIPLIIRHPAAINPGSFSGHVCTYDFFPSAITYFDLELSSAASLPGRDFSSCLRSPEGSPEGSPDRWNDVTFHEYENTRTIRTDSFKLITRHPRGPNELYDLVADPEEIDNRFDDPVLTAERASLADMLDAHFTQYCDEQYDLWSGGKTKAGRSIPESEMLG